MELLIRKAIKGDQDAFIKLMELNEVAMYKTAKAILANEEDIGDAMQETILAAYKHIDTLKKTAYFKTWLTRILINKCKDIIKANQKLVLVEDYDNTETCDPPSSQVELNACLESLPKEQQLILHLYYYQGFNTREISELLQENENTVKSRLSRSRQRFKEIFFRSV
ncbi:MAG: RNA polymerase sigma factor [Cellulosilyticaceae bacterium]